MENIIKIDINFLSKPLYFQNMKCSIGKKFVWTDIEGYEYHSGYTLPDYVDALILFYFLLRSQEQNYAADLYLTRYEIIKSCGFTKSPQTYERIKDSLERWSAVYLKFNGTFYDRKKYLTKFFHIMKAGINAETKKVEIVFDSDWLLKIKESNFFKYLNFEYYKELKRPISRRLYEILSPKCYDGNEWHVKLTKLGADLPISKRKIYTGKKEKEVLYASDVLVAIKPGFNDINRLAKSPDVAKKARALPGDVFTVEYRITGKGQDRVIHIKTNRIELPKKEKVFEKAENINKNTLQATPITKTSNNFQRDNPAKPEKLQIDYLEAINWIESIPYFNKKRQDEIALLPMPEIAKIYPGIRKKYEKLSQQGNKVGPGWVYKAFIEKWQFIDETQREFVEKEFKEKKEKIEKQKTTILDFISANGQSNLLYKGQLFEIMGDYGLYLANVNFLENWDEISLELFSIISP